MYYVTLHAIGRGGVIIPSCGDAVVAVDTAPDAKAFLEKRLLWYLQWQSWGTPCLVLLHKNISLPCKTLYSTHRMYVLGARCLFAFDFLSPGQPAKMHLPQDADAAD